MAINVECMCHSICNLYLHYCYDAVINRMLGKDLRPVRSFFERTIESNTVTIK